MRSRDTEFICPVKTKVDQEAPTEEDKVITILDGAIQVKTEKKFIGKAFFMLKDDYVYDFRNIDYLNIVWYNKLYSYREDDAIPCHDTKYHRVLHQGWYGYNSIGIALGLGVESDDGNLPGKIVFEKLLESGYEFKQTIEDGILNSTHLPSTLWLTPEISKFSIVLSFIN